MAVRRWVVVVVALWLLAGAVWVKAASGSRDPHAASPVPVVATERAPRFAPPRVEIGAGVDLDQAEAAAAVEQIINDPRSWNTDLSRFTFRLSLAKYVRVICGPPPVQACAYDGDTVWMEASKWTTLYPTIAKAGGTLADQRAWFVNHEIGHLLGLGHQECTQPGTAAPVMRAFASQLHGCAFNAWPAPDAV